MDLDYFKNYDQKGNPYHKKWLSFTINPLKLVKICDKIDIWLNSVIDLGAADGRWLLTLQKKCPEINIKGIEICKEIIPKNTPFIKHGNCLTYNLPEADLMMFGGISYFTLPELKTLFNKVRNKCNYFFVTFEQWNTIRSLYPKKLPVKIKEKTLRLYMWWVEFFYNSGYSIVYYDNRGVLLEPKENYDYIKEVRSHYYNADYIQTVKYNKNSVIVNKKIKIEYENEVLYVHNADYIDLISIQPFLCSFDISEIVAEGDFKTFIPGWLNNIQGHLNWYGGIH